MPESLQSNALITVADAESYLELAPGSDNDRIIMLINSVSTAIESYTARYYVPHVITAEKHDGSGDIFLMLNYAPLIALTKVALRDETDIPVNSIYVDESAGILSISASLSGRVFTEAFANVAVDYTAGYGTVAIPAIPADIKQACRDTVAYYWKRDFVEYTAELKQAVIGLPTSAFPNSAKYILDNYQRTQL
jgi:uncharacterized phiE125 gp8 family phage protein